MRAVVLVGGEGTRMRPLTETIPKPLLPLMDRASLDLVLDHLAAHAVHDVVLSSPYLEATFRPFIEARRGDPAITWVTETEPLGTGGAIVNALGSLDADGPFFALNGDILTDLDLSAMLDVHRRRGAATTIALHQVDDARAYGLVATDPDGAVIEFREKPDEPVAGNINAGTYVIEPGAIAGWPVGQNLSIERQIFPSMIGSGLPLVGFPSDAYWLDLGTPGHYLQAHFDMLEGKVHGLRYPAPWIAATAEVDPAADLGRRVAVGAGASIGPDATVADSVLLPGARVGRGSRVTGSIVGPGAQVGPGASLSTCVLGEGAVVPAGAVLIDGRVPSFTEA